MRVTTRVVGGKYIEIVFFIDNTTITTGLLDKDEAINVSESLKAVLYDIKSFSEAKQC